MPDRTLYSRINSAFAALLPARSGCYWPSDAFAGMIQPKRPDVGQRSIEQLIAACRHLHDGAPCGPEIYHLIEASMNERRAATGTKQGPPNSRLTGLVVRRSGIPEWWQAGGNLLLSGAGPLPILTSPETTLSPQPSNSVAIIGSGAIPGKWTLSGQEALLVIGDDAVIRTGSFSILAGSTIIIGERMSSISPVAAIAKNGGIIVVGPDALWSGDVFLMTDDLHSIRNLDTGKRMNVFGGRIVIDRHVWVGLSVHLIGDCYIGHDSVIGAGSLIKGAYPSHCVVAGRPAKVLKRKVTWSLDDLP